MNYKADTTSFYAQLIESNDIASVLTYATKESLVLMDIDNTVIHLSQTLGTPQWFTDFYNKKREAGFTHSEATNATLKIYVAVNKISEAQLVDANILSVIQQLHQDSIPILGLTSRDDILYEATVRQLKSAGITFKFGPLSQHEMKLNVGNRSKIQDGIIFTGGKHKGHCFQAFISTLSWKPKKIIFVDDQLNNLKEVEEVLQGKDLSYIGLRYNILDSKIKNINTKLHELQLQYLNQTNQLLSDEEALRLLSDS